jgi:uncharacterized RDD family membrane protein YckC
MPALTREAPVVERDHLATGQFDEGYEEQPADEENLGAHPPMPLFASELLDDPPPEEAPEDGPVPSDSLADEIDQAELEDQLNRPTLMPEQLAAAAAQVNETMPPHRAEAVELLEVIARPASAPRRLLAWTIDVGLWAALSTLLWMKSLGTGAVVGGLIAAALALLYTAVFTVALSGRSPGRLVAGLRLVTGGGTAPGAVRMVLRTAFAAVSFATCCAGFWLALVDRKGQTLHDKLTGTFVVRLDARGT